MSPWTAWRYWILLASLAVAGCGGYQSTASPAIPHPPTADAGLPAARDSNRLPLLYQSDFLEGVTEIYSWGSHSAFPKGTLLGQLNGPEPRGMCLDKSGDVYVADFRGQGIDEFARNSVGQKGFLPDPGNDPIGCAVSAATGDVAIANYETTKHGAGSVYVYPAGSENFKAYRAIGSPAMNRIWFLAYDPIGNLFVDGSVTNASGDVQVLELPKGGRRFVTLKLHGPGLRALHFPGPIQWDGRGHLDIGDRQTPTVYWTREVAGGLKQVDVMEFSQSRPVAQWYIHGASIFVPENHRSKCPATGLSGRACLQVYPYHPGRVQLRSSLTDQYMLSVWNVVIDR